MYTFTVDSHDMIAAVVIFAFLFMMGFLVKTFRDGQKDMKLIDQTADDRKKLIRFMYMHHLPDDLGQKLRDEFNAVSWEVHQDCLKRNGTARHLYPTFIKTYEWILK